MYKTKAIPLTEHNGMVLCQNINNFEITTIKPWLKSIPSPLECIKNIHFQRLSKIKLYIAVLIKFYGESIFKNELYWQSIKDYKEHFIASLKMIKDPSVLTAIIHYSSDQNFKPKDTLIIYFLKNHRLDRFKLLLNREITL